MIFEPCSSYSSFLTMDSLYIFKEETIENSRMRIFFYSKKTLLNEFNHFEGNINIFQPAIDISENILIKERNEILDKLNNL